MRGRPKRVGALAQAHEQALIGRFGDSAIDFVDGLATMLDSLRRRWGVQLGQPLSDERSHAASFYAWAEDGRPLVAKLYLDRGQFERERIAFRHWSSGSSVNRGAPLPLKEAEDVPALLFERIEGNTLEGTPEARGEQQRLAEMTAALHERAAGSLQLPEVEDQLLKRFLRAERQLGAELERLPLGPTEIVRAQVMLDALSDSCQASDEVVLHGALRPENVIASPAGLRAVSPRPLRGELSYDLACWALSRATQPLEAIKWRVGEICAPLGLNAERVLVWARVVAVVEALEHYARGLGSTRELEQAADFAVEDR